MMKALTGTTRILFLCFFISHIPITLLLDSQALFGSILPYPQALQDLLQNYAIQMKDPLMKLPFPPYRQLVWFQALIVGEILLQVPFFVWAVQQLSNTQQRDVQQQYYSERFRRACLIYGSHTATTLLPILATIGSNPEATIVERITLAAVYLPYLIFPVWLIVLAAVDDDDAPSNHVGQHKHH